MPIFRKRSVVAPILPRTRAPGADTTCGRSWYNPAPSNPESSMKVVVASRSFSKHRQLLGELRDLGIEVVPNEAGRKLRTPQEVAGFIGDAEVAIIALEPVGAEVLALCPGLRLVAKYGVGLDSIDQPALAAAGVQLGWTGGVNRRSVTELALAFALGHLRNVTPSVELMRRGVWEKDGGRQLSDVTFGIVGLGHIGTDLARILGAFGTRVLFCDIVDKTEAADELGLESVPLDELLERSDVVSLHVPSTDLTREMIAGDRLARMRPDALLINTARGDIVAFDEVVAAVRGGRLGGFASDVYPEEPLESREFVDDPHLYFTPHLGGNAAEAVLAMGRSAIAAVRAHLEARSRS